MDTPQSGPRDMSKSPDQGKKLHYATVLGVASLCFFILETIEDLIKGRGTVIHILTDNALASAGGFIIAIALFAGYSTLRKLRSGSDSTE